MKWVKCKVKIIPTKLKLGASSVIYIWGPVEVKQNWGAVDVKKFVAGANQTNWGLRSENQITKTLRPNAFKEIEKNYW